MRRFIATLKTYIQKRKDFDAIDTYVFFIGYPRSGHTLVRSLLDAHPNIIISNELDVFGILEKKTPSRKWLFSQICENSSRHARAHNQWTGYSYETPNLWQGRYTQLRAIGDKKGGVSTRRLSGKEGVLLKKLKKIVGVEIKVIHVVRNPYDNITTIANRSKRSLKDATEAYFDDVKKVESIKKNIKDAEVFEIHHEDVVSNPEGSIQKLCNFLKVEEIPAHVTKGAAMVYEKPHQSRYSLEWSDDIKNDVSARCAKVDFLKDYTYDS